MSRPAGGRRALAALALVGLVAAGTPAAATEPLKVCLEANSPPFSVDRRAEGEGGLRRRAK